METENCSLKSWIYERCDTDNADLNADNADMQTINTKLIHEELTYKVNGILFSVHNELGPYLNEKQYCDRIAVLLEREKISFEREASLPPSFEGEAQHRNRVDFFINGKVVLEVKAKRIVGREDYYQTQRYLKALNCKLALLVNFRQRYLRPKRIINSTAQI